MRAVSSASGSAQDAADAAVSANSAFRRFGPIRLTIICAVLLATFVVIGSALFLFNLHNRIQILNERNLSNNAFVLAKQIEQLFAVVEAVQTGIIEDIAPRGTLDSGAGGNQLAGHDLFIKLRDKAAGMPYVGSLAIIDAQGRLINFSREWPTPNIDSTDRAYFKAFQSNPGLTSFVGEPVLNHSNASWVVHLARKIPGPHGEFLGLITAAVDLQYLQKYFREISFEPGSGVTLFRTDGLVLARFPVDASIIGHRFPDALSLKLISTADHAVGVSAGLIDGHVRMIAAHRVGSFPIVLGTTKTTATIYGGWWQTVGYVAAMSVLTFVIIAAFAFLFVRQFRNYQALVQERAGRQKSEQLHRQSLQFDVALNNMSQGLIMFDSSERVVVCNQRYIELAGLAPEFMRPGRTLREILQARQTQSGFMPDIEEYRRELLDDMTRDITKSLIVETKDGRSHRIVNVPMAGGGWVATHEDITEQVIAKAVIEKQKFQLDAALENMSQGLCMFDAQKRLIVCNKRYAELYGLSDEQTKPGTELRVILEHRIARGTAPEDHESYFRDRLSEVSINRSYQVVNRLRDGRHVSVVHRPMPDGGWVATHDDVTEAKGREESFRLLFKANPMPMWLIDRESLRFLDVNEAAIVLDSLSKSQRQQGFDGEFWG